MENRAWAKTGETEMGIRCVPDDRFCEGPDSGIWNSCVREDEASSG